MLNKKDDVVFYTNSDNTYLLVLFTIIFCFNITIDAILLMFHPNLIFIFLSFLFFVLITLILYKRFGLKDNLFILSQSNDFSIASSHTKNNSYFYMDVSEDCFRIQSMKVLDHEVPFFMYNLVFIYKEENKTESIILCRSFFRKNKIEKELNKIKGVLNGRSL